MGLYADLIQKKEIQNRKCEEAADRLLMEDGTPVLDEISGVQAALDMILDGFGVEHKKILGCSTAQELIESTLDSAGLMSEIVDLSDRSFLRSANWILAWTQDNRPVVLRPGLLGYACVDVESKKARRLNRHQRLKNEGFIIHHSVSNGKGSALGIAQLILRLITGQDILAVLACTALISLLGMVLPALNAWALNTLLPQGSQAYGALVYGMVLFITVGIFRAALGAAKTNILSDMRIRIADQVQASLMAKVLLQPYVNFANASTGRISGKIHSGQQLANRIINVFLDTSFTLIFSLIYIPQMLRYGADRKSVV